MVRYNTYIGEKSYAKNNQIFCSHEDSKVFDFLIFLDSRGLTIDSSSDSDTFFMKLLNLLDVEGKSYLAVSRPKNLTIFATLINFLESNPDIYFKNLLTNLGFVDFTPKKKANIEDTVLQIKENLDIEIEVIEHEQYKLKNGQQETLYSVNYESDYEQILCRYLEKRFKRCYLINTPFISKDARIERERPDSFYKQIFKTNEFIDKIINLNSKKNYLIDVRDIGHAYDAVHYTQDGHQLIFQKIKGALQL